MAKRNSTSSVEEVDTSLSANEESMEYAVISDGAATVESDVEERVAPTSKRQVKLPAKFRDPAIITHKANRGPDFEAEMRDSKFKISTLLRC